MTLNIGANLENKMLTIVKSVLSLRQEDWVWVDDPTDADVWLVDLDEEDSRDLALAVQAPSVILITGEQSIPGKKSFHFVISPPLRAAKLIKALDQALDGLDKRRDKLQQQREAAQREQIKSAREVEKAKKAEIEARVAAEKERAEHEQQKEFTPEHPPPLPDPEHPWAGVRMKLRGKPGFSSYPITAELVVWLNVLAERPVTYEVLVASLPLDRDLLDTVLNAAAKHGKLVDANDRPIDPVKKKSFLGGLLGKKR